MPDFIRLTCQLFGNSCSLFLLQYQQIYLRNKFLLRPNYPVWMLKRPAFLFMRFWGYDCLNCRMDKFIRLPPLIKLKVIHLLKVKKYLLMSSYTRSELHQSKFMESLRAGSESDQVTFYAWQSNSRVEVGG